MENEASRTNEEVSQTPRDTPPSSQSNTQKNMLMAVLAYLSILIIIPFLTAKDDPFVKFHIKQGLVLFIIEILISALGMGMMWVFFPLVIIIHLGLLVLAIMGIVNAVQGQEKKLPLVGHLADNFTF